MDNENTIPSQLGPVNTIPAPLGTISGRDDRMPVSDPGMGFGLKLFLVALATGLLVYLIR